MNAGDLYRSVVFEAPTNAPDGHGGTEVGWDATGGIRERAHFKFLRGGETVQAARLSGRQPVVVTVRNHPSILAINAGWRMRDLETGKSYNVRTDPVRTDDRVWAEILVEGGVAI